VKELIRRSLSRAWHFLPYGQTRLALPSDRNRDQHQQDASEPHSRSQSLRDIYRSGTERAHKQPNWLGDYYRIECEPNTEVEERARKEKYGGEMVQHHAMIVPFPVFTRRC